MLLRAVLPLQLFDVLNVFSLSLITSARLDCQRSLYGGSSHGFGCFRWCLGRIVCRATLIYWPISCDCFYCASSGSEDRMNFGLAEQVNLTCCSMNA